MDASIRHRIEDLEKQNLSPYATLSVASKGRARTEEECDIRPVFQRDRDRILHSKSFRRLKDKTQVFITPEGDHYRTRLTHTLEVSQNARTIAKALRMNEDLVEAIALGHDLGHTPFGHAGERVLDRVCSEGFEHNKQSLRLVDVLERDGQGLNLTYEVRDGILNHQTSSMPCTLEGKIVRLSDKIAYMHHDMDDAIRGGILKEEDVPESIAKVVGYTTGQRLDTFIHDVVITSMNEPDIKLSEPVAQAMKELREFMFDNVYTNPKVKGEEKKAEELLETLFDHYYDHADELPIEMKHMLDKGEEKERVVCDFISSMTDRYAIALYEDLFIPKSWPVSRF
ncbi:MAG: deoxyguanosinetriphosphate triphosphohydrolase [Lachnospiraceae bacterium]|nr:deoxyguanosinetriphosphate triphosphohydrolase [Lachnospiraceae bacterium]